MDFILYFAYFTNTAKINFRNYVQIHRICVAQRLNYFIALLKFYVKLHSHICSQISGVNSLIQHTCNDEQEMPKNELLEEIKEMTVELKKRSTKISDLEENMDVLNEDLKQARNELSILKQHQKSEAADMESMSTSTVSFFSKFCSYIFFLFILFSTLQKIHSEITSTLIFNNATIPLMKFSLKSIELDTFLWINVPIP